MGDVFHRPWRICKLCSYRRFNTYFLDVSTDHENSFNKIITFSETEKSSSLLNKLNADITWVLLCCGSHTFQKLHFYFSLSCYDMYEKAPVATPINTFGLNFIQKIKMCVSIDSKIVHERGILGIL